MTYVGQDAALRYFRKTVHGRVEDAQAAVADHGLVTVVHEEDRYVVGQLSFEFLETQLSTMPIMLWQYNSFTALR